MYVFVCRNVCQCVQMFALVQLFVNVSRLLCYCVQMFVLVCISTFANVYKCLLGCTNLVMSTDVCVSVCRCLC